MDESAGSDNMAIGFDALFANTTFISIQTLYFQFDQHFNTPAQYKRRFTNSDIIKMLYTNTKAAELKLPEYVMMYYQVK